MGCFSLYILSLMISNFDCQYFYQIAVSDGRGLNRYVQNMVSMVRSELFCEKKTIISGSDWI